jgi:hypothetical protein
MELRPPVLVDIRQRERGREGEREREGSNLK